MPAVVEVDALSSERGSGEFGALVQTGWARRWQQQQWASDSSSSKESRLHTVISIKLGGPPRVQEDYSEGEVLPKDDYSEANSREMPFWVPDICWSLQVARRVLDLAGASLWTHHACKETPGVELGCGHIF